MRKEHREKEIIYRGVGRPVNSYPYLNPNLSSIANIIGIHNLLRLIRWHNQREIKNAFYVPTLATAKHPLARVIGINSLQKLSAEMGGLYIHFPKKNKLVSENIHGNCIMRCLSRKNCY